MSLASVPNLESELDELYALPAEQFTKARNELAVRLRKAHQTEAAAMVRALKKPSAVAWIANLLARNEPASVDALLNAADALRSVQQRALAGGAGPDEVDEASARERDALRILLSLARASLGPKATPPLLDRLAQTLRAAAFDESVRPLLRRGRLVVDLKAVGFGPLEAVTPRRRGDEVTGAARERVALLRTAARRLAADAQAAESAAADAREAARILGDEANEKRAEADQAAAKLADAEQSLSTRR
ncbi:MAG TPA: hypothetical protein VNC40_07125 [Gaiellaceae bacterium]|nr:hypothetical protein [Gaiellaceae bacterium]